MSALKKGFFKASQKVDVAIKGSKKYYDDEYNDLDQKFELTRKSLIDLQDNIENYLEPRKSSKARFNPNSKHSQNKDSKFMNMETKVADSLSKSASELDGDLSQSYNKLFEMFCRLSTAKETMESMYMDKIKSDILTRVIVAGDELKNVGKKVDNKRIAAQAAKMDKKTTDATKQATQEAFNSIKMQRQGMLIDFVVNSEAEYVSYITNFSTALEEYFKECYEIAHDFSSSMMNIQSSVNRKEKVNTSVYTTGPVRELTGGISKMSMDRPDVGPSSNLFDPSTGNRMPEQQWNSSGLPENAGWGAGQPPQPTNPSTWAAQAPPPDNAGWGAPSAPTSQNQLSSGWSAPSTNQQNMNSYNPFDDFGTQQNTRSAQNSGPTSKTSVGANLSNPFLTDMVASEPKPVSVGVPTSGAPETSARVVFDFQAENSDELSVKAGDVIKIVERIDENWFVASFRGKKGYVPKEFFEIIN